MFRSGVSFDHHTCCRANQHTWYESMERTYRENNWDVDFVDAAGEHGFDKDPNLRDFAFLVNRGATLLQPHCHELWRALSDAEPEKVNILFDRIGFVGWFDRLGSDTKIDITPSLWKFVPERMKSLNIVPDPEQLFEFIEVDACEAIIAFREHGVDLPSEIDGRPLPYAFKWCNSVRMFHCLVDLGLDFRHVHFGPEDSALFDFLVSHQYGVWDARTLIHNSSWPDRILRILDVLEGPVECDDEGILFHVADLERPDIVKLLLERGANPNTRFEDRVALTQCRDWDTFWLLINAGADIHAKTRSGLPLVTSMHPMFIPTLLDMGSDITGKTPSGCNVLFSRYEFEVLERLLLMGADTTVITAHGDGPLTFATSVRSARLLVDAGASLNATMRSKPDDVFEFVKHERRTRHVGGVWMNMFV